VAIIKGGDGRWKTIRTDAESTGRLLDSLKTLKPEEKALLRSVLQAAKNSNTKPFEALKNLEYEERPCPPEKFLEDPYYLGEIGKGTFSWIKRELPNVFYNGYDQIVCTGAQRTGKDWFSNCLTIYLIHLIMCLKDPATSYGLAKGSNLIIIAMSVTQELAKDVIFTGIVEKLKQSPWFQKWGKKINFMTDEIRFPKGLILKGSESSDMGIVGQNTVAVIIDEANLGRRTKAVHEKNQLVDRTEAIYQAVRRRIRMTFSKPGCPPTLLMTLGSRRYPSDFVERRIKELQGDTKAFVADYSVWDAKGRENFSEKYFKVLVGNEQTASRVLKDGEKVPKDMQVIEVPEDFKSDFEGDCDGALRDIGGIAVRTIAPYFANQALLHATVDDSRTHPAKTIEWKVTESLQIDWDKLVCLRDGKFIPIMSPDKPRCVAIDLGRVRNPTGFSIGYVKGWKSVDRKGQDGRIYQENLPVIVVEFIVRISPVQGEEVKFWQVREFLFSFIQHGIPIKYAVFDHWQCLAGETKVMLLSGDAVPIRDLAEKYPDGQPFWVYSYDPERRKVVPGKARAVGRTGEQVPLVEVELDSGQKVRCTDNHRFMLVDGTYREAKDLKPGDSLMALYRRLSERGRDSMTGYELFRRPGPAKRGFGKLWQYTHRMVAEELLDVPKGHHVHHKKGKLNNSPEAFEIEEGRDHFAHHGKEIGGKAFTAMWAKYKTDPEFRAEHLKFLRENVVTSANSPAAMEKKVRFLKAHASGFGKELWKDPKYVAKMMVLFSKRNEGYKLEGHPQWMELPLDRIKEAAKGCKSITGLAKKLGVAKGTLYKRLSFFGYTPERFYTEVFGRPYYAHNNPKGKTNHKVVAVRPAGFDDVYDVSVEGTSNFAIEAGSEGGHGAELNSGVFVHNSDDFSQLLKDQGIDSVQVKTDIKSYETFKSAVYEGRFKCYNYKPLYDEMMLLEYDPIKMKVDVAKDEMPNHLHHDVADSACLLVNRLSNDFRVGDYDPVMPTSDLPNRSGPDAGHTVLAPGDTPFELNPEETKMGPLPADNVAPPSTGYGFMFDQQELGWGAKELTPPTQNQYMQVGNTQYVRVELVAQEFCKRIGIENVQSVKSESIKAFLFEKGLTDMRYLTAIKTHIERVFEKQVV
jgi:hypothetical protein